MKINFNKQKLTNLYNQVKKEAQPYIEQTAEKLDEFITEAKPVAKKIKEKAEENIDDISKKTNPIIENFKQKAMRVLHPSRAEVLRQKISRKTKLYAFHELKLTFMKELVPENIEQIQNAMKRQEIRKQKLQTLIDEYNTFNKKQNAAQSASDILNAPKKLKD